MPNVTTSAHPGVAAAPECYDAVPDRSPGSEAAPSSVADPSDAMSRSTSSAGVWPWIRRHAVVITTIAAVMAAGFAGLGVVLGALRGMEERINDRMDLRFEAVDRQLDAIRADIRDIRAEMRDIRTEMRDIRAELVELRGDITRLTERVARLEGVVLGPADPSAAESGATDSPPARGRGEEETGLRSARCLEFGGRPAFPGLRLAFDWPAAGDRVGG